MNVLAKVNVNEIGSYAFAFNEELQYLVILSLAGTFIAKKLQKNSSNSNFQKNYQKIEFAIFSLFQNLQGYLRTENSHFSRKFWEQHLSKFILRKIFN